jgi:hypothetical protein
VNASVMHWLNVIMMRTVAWLRRPSVSAYRSCPTTASSTPFPGWSSRSLESSRVAIARRAGGVAAGGGVVA